MTLKYILKPLCILQGFLLGTGNSQSKTKDTHQSYFCKGQGQTTLQEKRNKTIFFSNGHLGTGRRKFFRKILAKHIGGTWPQQLAEKAPTIKNEHTSISHVSSCFFPSRSQQPPQPSTASAPLEETSERSDFLQDLQTGIGWSFGKRPNKENGSLLIHSKV